MKTVKFKDPKYIGDPLNAVRIFNEKEVDEIVFLDINASREGRPVDIELVKEISSQCFMPIAYGGGIYDVQTAGKILANGAEKVVINSASMLSDNRAIEEIASEFGSQSVVVCMNVKRDMLGRYRVYDSRSRRLTNIMPLDHARRVSQRGAGELIVMDVDRDGTQIGYDTELLSQIANVTRIPIVACGGAGRLEDFRLAIDAGASAAAAGSFFVLYGKHRAVLITYPDRAQLFEVLLPPEG